MSLDQKLLSIAFNDKKRAMELLGTADEQYFSPEFRPLFGAIEYYFNDPDIQDIPSRSMVQEYLKQNCTAPQDYIERYDQITGLQTPDNEFGWLLDKLRYKYNNSLQTTLIKRAQSILESKPGSKERVREINDIIKESVAEIDSVNRKQTYKEGPLSDSAEERVKRYEHVVRNPESAQGVLTGLTDLDIKTNGLHKGELMIIAGDTGTGKSVLMQNVAVNAYLGDNDPFDPMKQWRPERGHNVLYFSLEMPKESIERRLDACIANIIANDIRDGKLNEDDKRSYFTSLDFQANYDRRFYIVDMPKNVTTREIELKYLEVCATGWVPDIVVIDYMGIMSLDNASGVDWKDLGIISAELHEFARLYEIPVVTGSQVNKPGKDGVQRYNTDRIARSGMVPTNANVIVQIAKRGDDENQRTDMEVFITKLRDGESGGSFILAKDLPRMKVQDINNISLFNEEEDLV